MRYRAIIVRLVMNHSRRTHLCHMKQGQVATCTDVVKTPLQTEDVHTMERWISKYEVPVSCKLICRGLVLRNWMDGGEECKRMYMRIFGHLLLGVERTDVEDGRASEFECGRG